MPKNKRFSHNLKVPLSHCEDAALVFLQRRTDEAQAEHVRKAILAYARQHPDFDARAFRKFVAQEIAPKVRDADMRNFLDAQLDAFTKGLGATSVGEQSIPGALPGFRGSEIFRHEEK